MLHPEFSLLSAPSQLVFFQEGNGPPSLSEPFPASRGRLHSSAPGVSLLNLSSPSAGAGTLYGKHILVPVPQTQLSLGGTHPFLGLL